MDFSKLSHFIDTISDSYRIPNIDCSVYFEHEEVFRRRSGYVDLEGRKPASENDLYFIYSASKPTLAVATMQLVEKGLLSLSDPVAKYLPEFTDIPVIDGNTTHPCRNQATIEDLLSMQGGLDYQFYRADILALNQKNPNSSTQDFIHQYLTMPLQFEPGTRFLYSMCHDVMAAIIEIVSGMLYRDYVKKNIAEPLGMRDLYFHPTEENKSRLVQQYTWIKSVNDPFDIQAANIEPLDSLDCFTVFGDNYDSGGGGILCTVSDYVLLADALANDGIGRNGARILSKESIENMRRDRLCKISYDENDYPQGYHYGYGYGLGVRTLIDATKSRSPLGEFGWDGAAGAYFLCDTKNRIAIFSAMSVCDMYPVVRDVHTKYLRDLTYEAIFG